VLSQGSRFCFVKWAQQKIEFLPRSKWAILNFIPGPQGWTSTRGVNMAPRGKICPLGIMFTPPPGVNTLLFRRTEGRTKIFTPGGKVKYGPLF
jgi:hypothetical protein